MSPIEAKRAAWPFQPVISADYEVVGYSALGYAKLIAELAVRVLLGVSPVAAIVYLLVIWGWLPR